MNILNLAIDSKRIEVIKWIASILSNNEK